MILFRLSTSFQKQIKPNSVAFNLIQIQPHAIKTFASAKDDNVNHKENSSHIEQNSNQQKQHATQFMHKHFNKKLLLVNEQTRQLLKALENEKDKEKKYEVLVKFKEHLLKNPDTRITATHHKAVKQVNAMMQYTTNESQLGQLRITAALLGVGAPQKNGIRILSFDGGGSRGVISVEIVRELVRLTNKPIYELFDYICGVSTGAILAWMLGLKQETLDHTEKTYRDFSSTIFNQNRFVGTGKLMLSHSYYDTETYQSILKNMFGDQLLIDTSANENVPKCCAVSTLVNRHVLKPYVWRNYSIVSGAFDTHWPGTCRSQMWEAIYASSAAPGYFEEFKYGEDIHQDGGILTNNPAGVALNECRLLWPQSPVKCVVSVGTGKYEPFVGPTTTEFLSLKNKLLKIVDSATETNEVHKILYELLPDKSYYRFNPYISEPIFLDENRPEKLDRIVDDAKEYIKKNQYKFNKCAEKLME